MKLRPRDRDDFFASPHGGRPPSDEAVKLATERYVEQERTAGHPPSPEWDAAHPKAK